ncbi:hypothetical protein HDV02_001532 [Globomyces sp. JEL0801]|nr:hypothetical protein HDV02_001532 [Globomyces sp. JEL0801]
MEDELDSKLAKLIEITGLDDCELLLKTLLELEMNVEKSIELLTKRKRRKVNDEIEIINLDPDLPDNQHPPIGKPIIENPLLLIKDTTKPKPSLPMTLTKSNIHQHVPCELIPDILPLDLSNDLLLEMLRDSKTFEPLPVYMFEKGINRGLIIELVSPHTTCLYMDSHESVPRKAMYYNGTEDTNVKDFTELMRLVRDRVMEAVNSRYKHTPRRKLELQGDWKPNMVVVNHYAGPNESVGAHTDKITYIGPWPVIASLTLGASRTFRLRRNQLLDRPAQTYDVLLEHNHLLIMFPPTQEHYKHEVPKVGSHLNTTRGTLVSHPIAGQSRINLTFRMARPEYSDQIPDCLCRVPSELRPVTKKQATLGKYFYLCGKGQCGFFKWLEK